MNTLQITSPVQKLEDDILSSHGIELFIKREDLIHPHISGNKWRKLKYNLQKAKEENHTTLLSFGGAFSNHIAALAAAGKEYGFKTIGMIRGDAVFPLNPTLSFATECGMQLHFVDRESYREKESPEFVETMIRQLGDFYHIPEGGANSLGVKGCEEILEDMQDEEYDIICCACGTGATLAGIIRSLKNKSVKILGFPVLKGGEFLYDEIARMSGISREEWYLNCDFHFGGYAKINEELVSFLKWFEQTHSIPLEPVYTGKMLYGIYDLIKNGAFEKGTSVLAIHTGGLQGNKGFSNIKERF